MPVLSDPKIFEIIFFYSENIFWVWTPILNLKSYFDSKIIFWFWSHILNLKSYFDSEIIFWFWNHILILILLGILLIFWIVSGLKKRITCDIIKIFATSLCIMCMDSLISLVKTYFFLILTLCSVICMFPAFKQYIINLPAIMQCYWVKPSDSTWLLLATICNKTSVKFVFHTSKANF